MHFASRTCILHQAPTVQACRVEGMQASPLLHAAKQPSLRISKPLHYFPPLLPGLHIPIQESCQTAASMKGQPLTEWCVPHWGQTLQSKAEVRNKPTA
eukprot:614196-Pelagomonas_calceolata.AAC.1